MVRSDWPLVKRKLKEVSIEGGIPVEQSLTRVADELSGLHPDLCRELEIVARQANTGSVDQALEALGQRIDLSEVVACATTMRQGKRLGVSISDAIRESSDRIRDLRRQRAEQAGNLASLKLLLSFAWPVVLCLVPPVFILLIGPAILEFRDFVNRDKGSVSVVEQASLPTPTDVIRK